MNNLNGYEVMYLLDPELEEEGLEDKKERLKTIVESGNGEVVSMEEWGKKYLRLSSRRWRTEKRSGVPGSTDG